MDRGRLRATALGFAAAATVFGVLLAVVGVDDLLAELSRTDRGLAAAVVGLIVLWLVAWGLALRTVLSTLGVPLSPPRAILAFAGAMFANNVTPFGQAGGEPITALLLAETTDVAYERGLAAIASVDTLNFVPSVALAFAGVGYVAATRTLGETTLTAAAVLAALAVGLPLVLASAWRSRAALAERAVATLTPPLRAVCAALPRVAPPTHAAVAARVSGFVAGLERVGASPRRLALALAFSAVGWGCQMLALWLSLRAVGAAVSPAVPMIVVPLAAVAGITPLPGGAGGIEGALVGLLVAAPIGVTQATALAAVVVFRGAVYWLPTLVGGTVAAVVSARSALGAGD